MDRTAAQGWLDRYIDAWRTNEPEHVEALFTEDVEYRYHPFDEPIEGGRDGVVSSWLEQPDIPGTWDAEYRVFAVDGDRAVATGYSRYFATPAEPERMYHNCFLLVLDDTGRCSELTEFYVSE